MSVSTYGAIITRSFNAGTRRGTDIAPGYPGTPAGIYSWQADTGLGQGKYSTGTYTAYELVNRVPQIAGTYTTYDGPFYGTMLFGSGAGTPTDVNGKVLDSAQIFLARYNPNDGSSPGSAGAVPVILYASGLTDVPGSGASSPAGSVSGTGYTICSLTKGQSGWFDMPIDLVNHVIGGGCLAIYSGDSNLARLYGIENGTYKPQVQITWHDPIPALTPPSVNTVSTITTDSPTFSWGASSDANGTVSSNQISYEVRVSTDGGNTWGGELDTSAGEVSKAVNLRSYLSLAAGQYFYNTSAVVWIRARVTYGGMVYYAQNVFSNFFTIDYRVTPFAPSSINVSPNYPLYEGETATFTLGRPTTYNTKDASGNTLNLTYSVLLGSTTLISGNADVSNAIKVLSYYTVGNFTSGMADFSDTLYSKVTDADGLTSPNTTGLIFTVKRFRAPSVIVTNINRASASATVNFRVLDTGFGSQDPTNQIRTVTYSLDGTNYVSGQMGTWAGADNSFSIASWPEAKADNSISVSNDTVTTVLDVEDGTPVTFSGNAPIGLTVGTPYFAKRVDSTHIKLCTNLDNVAAGVTVDFTGVGNSSNRMLNISLSANRKYTLSIKTTNVAPGTLNDKPSAAATSTIYEYNPTLYAFHRSSATGTQAARGAYMQAAIIGDNTEVAVNAGSLVVQKDLAVGGVLTVGTSLTVAGKTLAVPNNASISGTNTGDVAMTTILAAVYPAGSLYLSTNSANPNTYFGFGTWVAWGGGRVPMGIGQTTDTRGQTIGFWTAETTGGEFMHQINESELASHTHGQANVDYYCTKTTNSFMAGFTMAGFPQNTVATSSTGGNAAHNNMQPYILCYIWKRTA